MQTSACLKHVINHPFGPSRVLGGPNWRVSAARGERIFTIGNSVGEGLGTSLWRTFLRMWPRSCPPGKCIALAFLLVFARASHAQVPVWVQRYGAGISANDYG